MPKPKTVPNKLLIGFSDEQLVQLDRLRRSQDDLPTRSEAVRRLVDSGMQQTVLPETWTGFLRLSLVTCPIALVSATSDTEVNLDQMNKRTGHGIRYLTVDSETGEEVANEDIVKGYKDDNGTYIEVTKGELDSIELESSRAIQIEEFVPRNELDVLYVIRSYYVVPDGKAGIDAFAVIRETIRSMNLVAIARVTLGDRERIIALAPCNKGMIGMLLRYSDEVRSPAQHFDDIKDDKVTKDLLDLAKHIVEQKTGHFRPEKFQDYYEIALTSLLAKKRNGLQAPTADRVVNLMDALKRSLKESE